MMTQKVGVVSALLLAVILGGCVSDIKLDPVTRTFYDRYHVFMTRDEVQLLQSLPDEGSRREFVRDFWDSRDPDPGTVENEFKIEADERIDAANQLFREGSGSGYDTDRGRIYILFGPPDTIDRRSAIQSYDGTGYELWIYDRWQLAIPFISKFGATYRLSTTNPSLLEAINTLKEEAIMTTGVKGGPGRLAPEIDYDRQRNMLVVSMKPSQLSYRREGTGYLVNVKAEGSLYQGTVVRRVSKTETISKTEDEFLRTERFVIELPLPEITGKVMARVVVSDLLGNRRVRKIKTIRIK